MPKSQIDEHDVHLPEYWKGPKDQPIRRLIPSGSYERLTYSGQWVKISNTHTPPPKKMTPVTLEQALVLMAAWVK
jgi:hypothetical protein